MPRQRSSTELDGIRYVHLPGGDLHAQSRDHYLMAAADAFVRDEVEPLDYVFVTPYDKSDTKMMEAIRPLQQKVKEQGLWAAHLPPDMGGLGFGQVKLGLMHEILGRCTTAPNVGAVTRIGGKRST